MLASVKHWLRGVYEALSKEVVIVYMVCTLTAHTLGLAGGEGAGSKQ